MIVINGIRVEHWSSIAELKNLLADRILATRADGDRTAVLEKLEEWIHAEN